MAVTFHPHPAAVLYPKALPPLLSSLEQRLEAFSCLGIRVALVIPFTRSFSRLSPEQFGKLLAERLKVKEVVVGHDFGFGRGRSGSPATLREMGRRYRFRVHVLPPVNVGGKRISSRLIRERISQGDLKKAAIMLGRPVTVVGCVVRGWARGKKLGFPTANLQVTAGVLPPRGVYAVWGRIRGRRYPGMANIGFRPTFGVRHRPNFLKEISVSDTGLPVLEVHLFGLNRSLYGESIEVEFVKRLRSERKFPSAQALAQQLSRDARRAQALLKIPTSLR